MRRQVVLEHTVHRTVHECYSLCFALCVCSDSRWRVFSLECVIIDWWIYDGFDIARKPCSFSVHEILINPWIPWHSVSVSAGTAVHCRSHRRQPPLVYFPKVADTAQSTLHLLPMVFVHQITVGPQHLTQLLHKYTSFPFSEDQLLSNKRQKNLDSSQKNEVVWRWRVLCLCRSNWYNFFGIQSQ